jgi:hypothetical protein
MQQAPRLRGFWKSGWGATIAFPVFSVACLVFVLSLPPSEHIIALRRVCDGAVKTLLASHDSAEIERSGVLINSLGCDVAWRIGADGAFRPMADRP